MLTRSPVPWVDRQRGWGREEWGKHWHCTTGPAVGKGPQWKKRETDLFPHRDSHRSPGLTSFHEWEERKWPVTLAAEPTQKCSLRAPSTHPWWGMRAAWPQRWGEIRGPPSPAGKEERGPIAAQRFRQHSGPEGWLWPQDTCWAADTDTQSLLGRGGEGAGREERQESVHSCLDCSCRAWEPGAHRTAL